MRMSVICLIGLILSLSIHLNPLIADDRIVGAIWIMKLKNPKGEWVEVTKFRATLDGKVFYEGKQVGTHTKKGADIEMVLDKRGPKLNGTYSLIKVKKDATWWSGTLKRDDGSEVPVRLGLAKD